MGANSANNIDDKILKQFFAEVSEVERDNEVNRSKLLSLAFLFLCVCFFKVFCLLIYEIFGLIL